MNKKVIYTEFEVFFEGFLKNTFNIQENELQQIKTNLRNTCDKYTKIKIPEKFGKIHKELSERKDIVITCF